MIEPEDMDDWAENLTGGDAEWDDMIALEKSLREDIANDMIGAFEPYILYGYVLRPKLNKKLTRAQNRARRGFDDPWLPLRGYRQEVNAPSESDVRASWVRWQGAYIPDPKLGSTKEWRARHEGACD